MRHLQQVHMKQLKAIAAELQQHRFPFDFYFSRTLDLDEQIQKQSDQRSIRFDRFHGQAALEVTGNYYAAYSDIRVDGNHRVRQTYLNVILPILKVIVPPLESDPRINEFAFEISHHVRRKVMGLDGEYPENVVVIVPRELAARVVQTKDLIAQQNLMLDAEVYRSDQPTLLWLAGDKPVIADDRSSDDQEAAALPPPNPVPSQNSAVGLRPATFSPPPVNSVAPLPELKAAPPHDTSPAALKALQEKYQPAIDKMEREQAAAITFVSYAPPTFIAFKNDIYLQISMVTRLDIGATDSQYKLAALAFDRDIVHLVRPVLGYFKDSSFDGIDFSTTVKRAGDAGDEHAIAVEFVLPLTALQRFQNYDCTGQQLLDAGIILINGERAGVQLETAEAR